MLLSAEGLNKSSSVAGIIPATGFIRRTLLSLCSATLVCDAFLAASQRFKRDDVVPLLGRATVCVVPADCYVGEAGLF